MVAMTITKAVAAGVTAHGVGGWGGELPHIGGRNDHLIKATQPHGGADVIVGHVVCRILVQGEDPPVPTREQIGELTLWHVRQALGA